MRHAREDRARREGLATRAAAPMFDLWTDGVFPSLADHAERVARDDGVRIHSHAAALNSSMVFGFNLFLPFRIQDPAPLAALLARATNLDLEIERIAFEYGPTEILAETRTDPPGSDEAWTSSDIGIEVRDSLGRRGIVLIEVKLTEDGFSRCNGRTSSGNRRPDVCSSARAFLAEPTACYLTRPLRARRDRRYWEIFAAAHGSVTAAFPGVDQSGPCPFAFDLQQPMRNHALALGLVQQRRFDFARFGLVHHDDNPDVVPHWEQYRTVVTDPGMLFRVPASRVVEAGRALKAVWSAEWADYVCARYLLTPGVER